MTLLHLVQLRSFFLSALTWGTKEDRDGVREDEELGRRITEQSSKVGYFILTLFILVAVGIDQWVHEKPSLLLLSLLGLSIVTLPFIEWVTCANTGQQRINVFCAASLP